MLVKFTGFVTKSPIGIESEIVSSIVKATDGDCTIIFQDTESTPDQFCVEEPFDEVLEKINSANKNWD